MNLLKKILFRGGGKSVPTSVLVPLKVTNFFVNEIIKSKIGFDPQKFVNYNLIISQ